jgi:dTDP-4-dehydrorhamnose reductase
MRGIRLVVIGSGGRLGAAVARHFRLRGDTVVAFDRRALDFSQPDLVRDRLEPLDFDACIVTAALTNIDYCESHPDEARAANVQGPAAIAEICTRRRARLVHVSTDYVYDGTAPGLRAECDPTGPVNVYGSTKLDGERRVLEISGGTALIARTSWIFGPDRPSFPDDIIARARASDRVEAISDKESTPTFTGDFSAWIEPFLMDPELSRIGGPLNFCNAGIATWHSYAKASVDSASALGIPLRCRVVTPIPLAALTTFRAQRPIHTAMDIAKFSGLTGIVPRPWQEALYEYLQATIRR